MCIIWLLASGFWTLPVTFALPEALLLRYLAVTLPLLFFLINASHSTELTTEALFCRYFAVTFALLGRYLERYQFFGSATGAVLGDYGGTTDQRCTRP